VEVEELLEPLEELEVILELQLDKSVDGYMLGELLDTLQFQMPQEDV
jgi:hypothetical protein